MLEARGDLPLSGHFSGVITYLRFFHLPFGMGGGGDDVYVIISAATGGYIGYWLPTMRLSPFSRS